VPNMDPPHKKVPVADFSDAVFCCPAMNCAVLANQILLADFHSTSGGGRETNVLRLTSDNRAVPDSIAPTDGYFPFNHDICADHTIVSDGNGATNNAMRTDLNVRANLRTRTDNGSQMNHLKHTCFLEAEVRRAAFSWRTDDDVIKE